MSADVLSKAESWLQDHPRGQIELLAAAGGFIARSANTEPDTGFDPGVATGFGPTLLGALSACLSDDQEDP